MADHKSVYDRVYYYHLGSAERARLVSKLKSLLKKKKEIKLAWLFGSMTRRNTIRDVDLAVYFDPQPAFDDFLQINSEIERVKNAR